MFVCLCLWYEVTKLFPISFELIFSFFHWFFSRSFFFSPNMTFHMRCILHRATTSSKIRTLWAEHRTLHFLRYYFFILFFQSSRCHFLIDMKFFNLILSPTLTFHGLQIEFSNNISTAFRRTDDKKQLP